MDKKIGRNEPCWCKSGKKYKKCHLDRGKEIELTRSDLEKHVSHVLGSKKCSVSNVFPHQCAGQIVNAHTISKSGSLAKMAEDGHVIGVSYRLGQLFDNDDEFVLTRIGIKQASTFTGFCAFHDKQIFTPLEDKPITLSDEQLFLVAYRALVRELYAKEISVITADFLRHADKGRGIFDQVLIQNFAQFYGSGVNIALNDFGHIKNEMDNMLKTKEFGRLNHFIIEMVESPKIQVAAATQPFFDFNGNRIQYLDLSGKGMSYIIFNCISYDEVGCFIFSWLDEHDEICRGFINSLVALGLHEIGNALVRFCYSYAENTWAAPDWWRSLSSKKQRNISARLQDGTPLSPRSNDCLISDGIEFNAFRIAKTSFRTSSSAT